ncbi:MAG: hypothetical protein EBS01_06110, partial [Verrucomicrobia bacterium]|nr:hypothetical protein [Verrucomicrobiota bacterium]
MKFKKFIRKLNSQLRQARKYRTPFIFAVALVVFGILQLKWVAEADALKKIEGQTIDKRFSVRNDFAPLGQHPEVEVVGITTQSLDQGLLAPLLEEAQALEDKRLAQKHPELFTPVTAPATAPVSAPVSAPSGAAPGSNVAGLAPKPDGEAPSESKPKEAAPEGSADAPKSPDSGG